jgi:hypothetical protein
MMGLRSAARSLAIMVRFARPWTRPASWFRRFAEFPSRLPRALAAASAALVLAEIIFRSACATTAMMPTTISFASGISTVAGSGCDKFNQIVMNQAVRALWLKHSDEATRDQQYQAALSAMMGIAPRDEVEGMLAAQMVAAHNAVMECYRRAMLDEQTFEGHRENLNQANKLSRTYTMQMDALNRHRGKGQQKVTVEHVHVHAGGQAVVGAVETGGGVASGNQGTTPCTSPYPCTCRAVVEREPGARARAARRRCRTVAAACTEVAHPERRGARRTVLTVMAASPARPLSGGAI